MIQISRNALVPASSDEEKVSINTEFISLMLRARKYEILEESFPFHQKKFVSKALSNFRNSGWKVTKGSYTEEGQSRMSADRVSVFYRFS